MEGLLHSNLGFTRQAERVLQKARKGFIRLSDPVDFVLVTIDLARVLLLDGEDDKYERLQHETIAALREMTTPAELEEALTQWRRQPHTEETLEGIKIIVKNLA